MRISFSARPALFSRGNLLTRPKGVELIGELADGGRPHQSRDPLLSLVPVRQCRLDRGLACGREMLCLRSKPASRRIAKDLSRAKTLWLAA
jgi:hypothetical protein